MPNQRIHGLEVIKVDKEDTNFAFDSLAVEEPLEIQIEFGAKKNRVRNSISVTMRTPQHDSDLAIGFLFTEGIIASYKQIKSIGPNLGEDGKVNINAILVVLDFDVEIDLKKLERHFYTSSSCGVCGKSSIEAVKMNNFPILPTRYPYFQISKIHLFPNVLKVRQTVFKKTGGLHAAALFDTKGKLHLLREDVGRHNAVDKLIGASLSLGLFPMNNYLIMVSGRVSFELVQKSIMGGIPILAAVGAPSSLAIQLAKEYGMTVLGFVKNNKFNIYSHAHRIIV
jgi:FdhD protein